MPLAMLPERDLAVDERRFNCGKLCRSHVLFAEKAIDRPCPSSRHETPFCIDPSVAFGGGSRADKYRTRCAKGDQLVGIDRQVAPIQRTGVFEEVASHPMILTGTGNVLDKFAEIAAVEFGAAFAGRTHIRDREPLIQSHRH